MGKRLDTYGLDLVWGSLVCAASLQTQPHSRVWCVCVWVGVCVIVFGKYLLGTCRVRNVGVCDTASGHVPLAARPL